ncbi:MAG: ADP-ribosylglycohydrolase family protein [Propionibacterium sp.]
MSTHTTIDDRAHGALLGLAIGDALGMPTQSLARETIRERYGRITGFLGADDAQPIAPGMPAGSVTDDTEQAVLVGRLLVEGDGRIDAHVLAQALLDWEASMIERGSFDLLGPSTKAALAALQAGTPIEEAGRYGTTNGAAMRIAPVGIAYPVGRGLLEAVVGASRVTHHTGLGISGAAAIAAAVSAGIDGEWVPSALEAAVDAARDGERLGHWIAGASIAERFQAVRPRARTLGERAFADFLYQVVGTSVQSQESVVSALLIADRYHERPFEGLTVAASLGGDTDTVAAMAGAVLGACRGAAAFPPEAGAIVESVNALDLEPLANRLLALRRRAE